MLNFPNKDSYVFFDYFLTGASSKQIQPSLPRVFLANFNKDVTLYCLSFFSIKEMRPLSLVCHTWLVLSKEALLLRLKPLIQKDVEQAEEILTKPISEVFTKGKEAELGEHFFNMFNNNLETEVLKKVEEHETQSFKVVKGFAGALLLSRLDQENLAKAEKMLDSMVQREIFVAEAIYTLAKEYLLSGKSQEATKVIQSLEDKAAQTLVLMFFGLELCQKNAKERAFQVATHISKTIQSRGFSPYIELTNTIVLEKMPLEFVKKHQLEEKCKNWPQLKETGNIKTLTEIYLKLKPELDTIRDWEMAIKTMTNRQLRKLA